MFSISNKHEEFFDYLITNANSFKRGAIIAYEAMNDLTVLPERMKEITELEHNADKTNLDVMVQLARIFITPIDREDFYNLTCSLEECIDNLHGFLMRVDMYHIEKTTPAAVEGTKILVDMGDELNAIFELLKNIDKNQAERRTAEPHGNGSGQDLPSGNVPSFHGRRSPLRRYALEGYYGRYRRNVG